MRQFRDVLKCQKEYQVSTFGYRSVSVGIGSSVEGKPLFFLELEPEKSAVLIQPKITDFRRSTARNARALYTTQASSRKWLLSGENGHCIQQ